MEEASVKEGSRGGGGGASVKEGSHSGGGEASMKADATEEAEETR